MGNQNSKVAGLLCLLRSLIYCYYGLLIVVWSVSYTHLDVYKRQLPELEIEQERHAQQNSSPDIRIQFMTCS